MGVDWIKRALEADHRVCHFIDGHWSSESDGALKLSKYGPRDGQLLYQFSACGDRGVDRAVLGARKAFEDGRWAKLPVQHRKEALYRLAALIEKHKEELALLECLDVGKPISDALNFDVPSSAAVIRFCAEAADKIQGKVYAVSPSSFSYQLQQPVGVVAGIIGWNFPLLLAAGKVGPVLSTGNSLVLKPSELTSLSAARLAELAIEAGVPEGVFNVIHGGREVGAALAHHSGVNLLTFTGSSRTGKQLLIASGTSNMKQLILECGGKAPNIVFDDCPNLEAVADGVAARAFWNQGQVCTASSRLLVQETVREVLEQLVIKRAAALRTQDPLHIETKFGAMVSQEHQRKVRAYVEGGPNEGARTLYQSDSAPPFEAGFYVPPVIFGNVTVEQKLAQEEIFGPVLSVMSFRDEDEAVRIANTTLYGLSAIVWTRNLGRAHRMAQQIRAGWVCINATDRPVGGPAYGVVPIGGHKESGLGVEGGLEGIEAYMTKTAVQQFV